jgi:uncharacterized metal-binding protein YceD (DUF177 family)
MHEHRSARHSPPPWQVPVAAEEVAEAGARFDLTADARVRGAVARLAELRDLPRFEANFDVTRRGDGGLHVAGRVSATVAQTCVVTLEPLQNEVAEAVDLVFMPQSAAAPQVGEGASPDAGPAAETEPLTGGVIDLGAIAIEFLILGLDPYPRKPGALFQPPRQTEPDQGAFAALAPLKKGSNDR